VFNRKLTTAEPPKAVSRVLSALTRIKTRLFGRRRKPEPTPQQPETPAKQPDFGPNIEDYVPSNQNEAVAWLEAMTRAIRDLAAEMIAAGALQGVNIQAAVEAERHQHTEPPPYPRPSAKPQPQPRAGNNNHPTPSPQHPNPVRCRHHPIAATHQPLPHPAGAYFGVSQKKLRISARA
jgi:hypothetical protein